MKCVTFFSLALLLFLSHPSPCAHAKRVAVICILWRAAKALYAFEYIFYRVNLNIESAHKSHTDHTAEKDLDREMDTERGKLTLSVWFFAAECALRENAMQINVLHAVTFLVAVWIEILKKFFFNPCASPLSLSTLVSNSIWQLRTYTIRERIAVRR